MQFVCSVILFNLCIGLNIHTEWFDQKIGQLNYPHFIWFHSAKIVRDSRFHFACIIRCDIIYRISHHFNAWTCACLQWSENIRFLRVFFQLFRIAHISFMNKYQILLYRLPFFYISLLSLVNFSFNNLIIYAFCGDILTHLKKIN